MPTLRKLKLKTGDFHYFIDFYRNVKRYRISTGTNNKILAKKALDKIKGDLACDKFELPQYKKTSLRNFIRSYLEYSKNNKAPRTYENDKAILDLFYTFLGDKNLEYITIIDCENYKNHRLEKVSKTTVNIDIRTLKAAFNKAKKWHYISENPWDNVKQLKLQVSTVPEYLTKPQVKKLLEVVKNEKFKELIIFYLYTGSRRNEALNLKWQDINLRNKRITFHITKSGKSRAIPINPILYKILKTLHKDKKPDEKVFEYDRFFVTHKAKEYLNMIGYNGNKSVHVFRHTFASHLVMSGTPLFTVQKLLGHSDIRQTEIYSHLAPDYLTKSIEKLKF